MDKYNVYRLERLGGAFSLFSSSLISSDSLLRIHHLSQNDGRAREEGWLFLFLGFSNATHEKRSSVTFTQIFYILMTCISCFFLNYGSEPVNMKDRRCPKGKNPQLEPSLSSLSPTQTSSHLIIVPSDYDSIKYQLNYHVQIYK